MNTRVPIWALLMLLHTNVQAQATTGRIAGTAGDGNGHRLPGTSVLLTDTVSGFAYQAIAGRSGRYLLENIPPGDQYLLTATYSGHEAIVQRQISVKLGETTIADLVLIPAYSKLKDIQVTGYRHASTDTTGEARLSPAWREKQPGKEWIHYVRNQPDIRTMPGNEDAVSLGGQNNRFNAFYIDGAILNDVFGLSASGTNGGTTGASPVSMESIDQIVISTIPYDAAFGKFTGGTIQMTTRTGTKHFTGSWYSNWSPGWLSGKLPGVEEPYTRGAEHIIGMRMSGRLPGDKWLYFLNRETQESVYPQAFNWQQYPGNIQDKVQPDLLRKALQDRYGYDPGNYLNTPAYLHADRFFMRVDGKPSSRSSFMLSFRYSSSRRDEQGNANPGNIAYAMHGYMAESFQQVLTAEWKNKTGAGSGNRLLATFTQVSDRRLPAGRPLPELHIYDGDGALTLGSDNNAAFNYLKQQNITLFDQWYWRHGKHILRMGVDAEFDEISNTFLQNSFGTYSYASVTAFLSGYSPSGYETGFVTLDGHSTRNAPKEVKARFLRVAFFLGDECRLSDRMRVYLGIRFDKERLFAQNNRQLSPDPIFEEQVRNYWKIESIVPGRLPIFPTSMGPRLQWWWQQKNGALLTAGIGVFTGKMPLAWLAAPLLHNGSDIGGWKAGNTALNHIRFSQDTDHPWLPESFGESPNQVPFDLSAPTLKMPSILRSSVSYTGKLASNIHLTLTGIYSLQLTAINYTNINLLAPAAHLSGPDMRPTYTYSQAMHIPVSLPTGNPYASVIYLQNEALQKGYAYEATVKLTGSAVGGTEWEAGYSYGRSYSIHDGSASLLYSNWRFRETVNGRNYPALSVSDYSPGHHLTARYMLTLSGKRFKKPWLLSITYNGQSGALFSYTYDGRSLQKEDETTGSYELMYIPITSEISQMHFQPFTGKQAYYPEQLQRELFETYLNQNSYLKKHRGQYATRNSSRTPWENTVDLQVRKKWRLLFDKTYLQIECSLACYNFLNLVNPDWGIHYRVSFDNHAVLQVAGFKDPDGLEPVYRFNPEKTVSPLWLAVSGRKNTYRSQWSCQFGFRITL